MEAETTTEGHTSKDNDNSNNPNNRHDGTKEVTNIVTPIDEGKEEVEVRAVV